MRVPGVREVRNELAVVLPTPDQRNDWELRRTAERVLRADVLVPRGAVRATAAGGSVELVGEVSHDAERRAAGEAVQRLVGVKGVTNVITVRPATPPEGLHARVEAALARSAGLRGTHIKVDTQGSTVLLLGRVRSLAERADAERVAWDVRGVSAVRNELLVDR